MGTDIHAVFQKRTSDGWKDVSSEWDQGRQYFLFAWLANVRNGFGFAGVRTHEPLEPIHTEHRGLPVDFEMIDDVHPRSILEMSEDQFRWAKKFPEDYLTPDGRWGFFMGDHSHTWLHIDEILSAKRPGGTISHGIITRADFEKWDGTVDTLPKSFLFEGPGVVDARKPLPPEAKAVRISWTERSDGLQDFVDEIGRLKREHNDVRMVFGFDS